MRKRIIWKDIRYAMRVVSLLQAHKLISVGPQIEEIIRTRIIGSKVPRGAIAALLALRKKQKPTEIDLLSSQSNKPVSDQEHSMRDLLRKPQVPPWFSIRSLSKRFQSSYAKAFMPVVRDGKDTTSSGQRPQPWSERLKRRTPAWRHS